ncbi:polysaccharide deacetylase family protein [Streptomyces sp. NPDC021093]|uniref:polysaccharide deacetylase family protein n=1 Tax=Streptomyces sp. NPDC021093 TaxID=3365112 RepID=UPI0037B96DF3
MSLSLPRRAVLHALLPALTASASAGFAAPSDARAAARPAGRPPAVAPRPAPLPAVAPAPLERLFGRAVRTIPTSRRVMALTFNAAWDDSGLDTVLTVLRQQEARATFFLTGQFAERHPRAAHAIATAGHGLGNHSHTHPRFKALTPAERAAEVTLAQHAIRRAIGTEPLPFFRFPYGATSPARITEVNAMGFADIEWTTDTNGYKGLLGGMTVQKAVERAMDALRPGAILQMHVGSLDGQVPILDAQALPQIIDAVRTRGYEIADLRTLLV